MLIGNRTQRPDIASAKNDYLDGVRWWYDKKEIIELNNQAMQFAAHDPLLEQNRRSIENL